LLLGPAERRLVAYHEAGHALAAWLLPGADPIYKVSIIPRGKALGITEQIPGEDRYNHSRTSLLTRLTVLLGGRTAEEIVIGEMTTGAENDLQEAVRLARHMVTRWAMGPSGIAAVTSVETESFLGYDAGHVQEHSELMAARIDQDVQTLLEERRAAVHCLLTEARALLDDLAQALLEVETLDQADLQRLLGSQGISAAVPHPDSLIPVLQLH
jgi:cell division protease FtsH